ncbi:uncharacterized protein LOC119553988 [Drosophila subpulchrella]|uniref:uncharacterized protein LOC119553988 n=1 Tax=Drosophila subpulchrella TaxID=1486046 RepID=UPI0018A142F0|nr:uncharacterized protein LOC119553988 [Drosophila subpulchrella]
MDVVFKVMIICLCGQYAFGYDQKAMGIAKRNSNFTAMSFSNWVFLSGTYDSATNQDQIVNLTTPVPISIPLTTKTRTNLSGSEDPPPKQDNVGNLTTSIPVSITSSNQTQTNSSLFVFHPTKI